MSTLNSPAQNDQRVPQNAVNDLKRSKIDSYRAPAPYFSVPVQNNLFIYPSYSPIRPSQILSPIRVENQSFVRLLSPAPTTLIQSTQFNPYYHLSPNQSYSQVNTLSYCSVQPANQLTPNSQNKTQNFFSNQTNATLNTDIKNKTSVSNATDQKVDNQIADLFAPVRVIPTPNTLSNAKQQNLNQTVDLNTSMRKSSTHSQLLKTETQIEFLKTFGNQVIRKPDTNQKIILRQIISISKSIFKYENGSIYQGDTIDIYRHGQGKLIYRDGTVFQGRWKRDFLDGVAIVQNNRGEIIYEGEWLANNYHGRGILFNRSNITQENYQLDPINLDQPNVTQYEGQFVSDQKDGTGFLCFTNGDRYFGGFVKDVISGAGTFTRASGDVFVGEFQNFSLVQQI